MGNAIYKVLERLVCDHFKIFLFCFHRFLHFHISMLHMMLSPSIPGSLTQQPPLRVVSGVSCLNLSCLVPALKFTMVSLLDVFLIYIV
ncbi:hypothetical protein PILCRDRAFT_199889 [Piloderma croceum F 1598]|uniref:Uncharacterized protein n=1 Tax=Piloderma croceum (strain F 1598) TaxID=765440 RepID=A0A0C3BTJ2_PILCF|nr:hypothetical protein PILCRDRAFT_199889 [Piloderma croceum F 1598]